MTTPASGRTRLRRVAVLLLATGTLVAATAAPAFAQTRPGDGSRRVGLGDQFVREGESLDTAVVAIDGDATIAGRTTKTVLVVKGDAVVSGRVEGDLIVIRGDARISGRVDEDVVVLGGRAILTDGAVVRGDVSSTDEPRVDRGALVSGDKNHIDATGIFTAIGFSILGFLWLSVSVSTALLGIVLLLLFRRGFESSATTEREQTGRSVLVGLATAVGIPLVAVVAITVLVGIPFGLGLLGAHGLLWSLGYVISALCLGRTMIKAPRSAFGAFFAGWGILRVLALIPGLGVLVWIGASVFGLGALVLTALRSGRGDGAAASASPDPGPSTSDDREPSSEAAPPDGTSAEATSTETSPAKKSAAKKSPAKKSPAKQPPPSSSGAAAGG